MDREVKQDILNQIRETVGEEAYHKAVKELGEDKLVEMAVRQAQAQKQEQEREERDRITKKRKTVCRVIGIILIACAVALFWMGLEILAIVLVVLSTILIAWGDKINWGALASALLVCLFLMIYGLPFLGVEQITVGHLIIAIPVGFCVYMVFFWLIPKIGEFFSG